MQAYAQVGLAAFSGPVVVVVVVVVVVCVATCWKVWQPSEELKVVSCLSWSCIVLPCNGSF